MSNLEGAIVPMLTPFKKDGTVDYECLELFTDWLIEQGARALFPISGSGERNKLSLEEKKLIMEVVVKKANKRVYVLPGVAHNSIEETISLLEYAHIISADGVVVVVPRDINPTNEDIFNYYKRLDEISTLPIYLYEPGNYYPYSISPELFELMAKKLKNIKGIKDSSSNMVKISEMVRRTEGLQAKVIQGNEMLYLSSLVLGIRGVIGGGCNLYPNLINKLLEAFDRKDLEEAKRLQWDINTKWNILGKSWPLSGKVFLKSRGLPFEPVCRVETNPLSMEDIRDIENLIFHLSTS